MENWLIWLARLMYLGLFLIAVGMLFRVWKIALRRDLRYVVDWRGQTIPNGGRWAAWVLSANLIGGICLLATAVAVLAVGLPFAVWTGLAGLVLWTYYFLLRVIVNRSNR